MNGVRRFLGGGGGGGGAVAPQEQPPAVTLKSPPQPTRKLGPSWPPEDTQPPSASPKTTTAGLFLKKDKQRLMSDDRTSRSSLHFRHSSKSSESYSNNVSSPRPPPPLPVSSMALSGWAPAINGSSSSKRPVPSVDTNGRPPSGPVNIRDELLVSLLASEAVVDSRDCQILTSEEVEELKKEQQALVTKLDGLTRKLATETKIRDAALSLSRAGASSKKAAQTPREQLDTANKRVDATEKELNRVSVRSIEINRQLMEHRAGVLSLSVRNMERKNGSSYDSGYNTPSKAAMSPTSSSMTGVSASTKPRFDGAHLFAGHADAIVPRRQRASDTEVTDLEDKLKAASNALSAASKKQAELSRELTMMKLEKQEVEVILGMELQNAQDTISQLEQDGPRLRSLDDELQALRREKQDWERERMRQQREMESLRDRLQIAESSRTDEGHLAELRRQLDATGAEMRRLQDEWEDERARLEDEKLEDLARLQEEQDRLREDDRVALAKANADLEDGLAVMQDIIQAHEVRVYGRDMSFRSLLSAVATYLEGVKIKFESHTRAEQGWNSVRAKLEEDVRVGMDKREALLRDIETRARSGSIDSGPRSPLNTTMPIDLPGDSGRTISILMPIWQMLPSPEARAAKFSGQNKFRAGSPVPSSPGGQGAVAKSLSELDVRSLKTLYDNRPSHPPSPNPSAFSIEAFASRVQALIADDKALIERLIRFAQAHDLLKKNAERAQKLAQESNVALETYSKQVKTLEERAMSATAKQAAMQEEVQQLQETVDRITWEKQEIEMQAAAQAETCQQLTEANNTLSAKTLALAAEAASAPDQIKKQLAETKAALDSAQAEIDAMRMSEQSQKVALLDELNALQTDNGQLREQLRALKR